MGVIRWLPGYCGLPGWRGAGSAAAATVLLFSLTALTPPPAHAATVGGAAGHARVTAWSPARAAALGQRFGISVGVSGTTAVIGAEYANSFRGRTYVFVRSGTGWHRQTILADPAARKWDVFGHSVSVSSTAAGTFAVIGAPTGSSRPGTAYVFARSGTVWHRRATLADPSPANGDDYGGAVAISRSTAVIGADFAHGGAGAAYIFVRSGRSWHLQATLHDPVMARGTTSAIPWLSRAGPWPSARVPGPPMSTCGPARPGTGRRP